VPSRRRTTTAFGVDIGGSGIKGAIVDLDKGDLATERVKYLTPHPSTPEAVAEVVARLVKEAGWSGDLGATFPAVIKNGVAKSAANVDKSWIGTDVDKVFTDITKCDVTVLNDADAAGVAEVAFGAGRDQRDLIMMLTFGTGIGSALFLDGTLIPNTEFGHLELNGKDAELRAADRVREQEDMSWEKWASRVEEYLKHVEALLAPRLFIIGGGVSRKADRFFPLIDIRTPMVAATLLNNAGIIGAAVTAEQAGVVEPGGVVEQGGGRPRRGWLRGGRAATVRS
jgi:polyphosphate glucokinase